MVRNTLFPAFSLIFFFFSVANLSLVQILIETTHPLLVSQCFLLHVFDWNGSPFFSGGNDSLNFARHGFFGVQITLRVILVERFETFVGVVGVKDSFFIGTRSWVWSCHLER